MIWRGFESGGGGRGASRAAFSPLAVSASLYPACGPRQNHGGKRGRKNREDKEGRVASTRRRRSGSLISQMIEKSRTNYPRVRATLPQRLRGGSPPTRVPVKTGQIAESRHPLFLFPPSPALSTPSNAGKKKIPPLERSPIGWMKRHSFTTSNWIMSKTFPFVSF